MQNHFDKFVNLKDIILKNRPKLIVECGAGNGDNTKKLLSLKDEYDFELIVIGDNDVNLDCGFINGISYLDLENLPDNSIDLCIVDTDHNYWTLYKELGVLKRKLSEGGLIVIHDVDIFYHNTGMALSYSNGKEYPREIIEEFGKKFGGLGDCVIDFLASNRMEFRMIRFITESCGVAVLKKEKVKDVVLMTPGLEPVFARRPND